MAGADHRSILHVDMNAFYCSCHAAMEPERYAGIATAVAGDPETRHGVIVTASYEARKRGVRTTMTVGEALRHCPELTLIPANFELYRAFSRRVFEAVRTFTPQIEVFSIDECFADVTGSSQFGSPLEMANQLQSRIHSQIGLPSSIGVAPNKFLAKMASDIRKPMGITEIWEDDVRRIIWPLPIGDMFGVGKKTAERLERLGIHTIGRLAVADESRLSHLLGRRAGDLIRHANGIDDSPVIADRGAAKSIGHSITLARDTEDLSDLCTVVMNLADQVGRRARHHNLSGKTVQITIRYSNRQTVTRAKTLKAPTNLSEVIYDTARWLLVQHKRKNAAVRLLGVSLLQLKAMEDLEDVEDATQQLSLFDGAAASSPDEDPSRANAKVEEKLRKLAQATDYLRDKYGENIILRGRMFAEHSGGEVRDAKAHGTSFQKDHIHVDESTEDSSS